MLRVKVELDRKPLRYTFVSHRPDFGDPVVVMTDADGIATFRKVPRTAKIDLVVHAHNLAVRMLDGRNAGVSEIALRFRNKANDARVNITPANDELFEHFVIMDRCYRVYENVFAGIAPFSGPRRGTHPFGGQNESAINHRRSPKVDCRYPEVLVPGKLPWVQPQSLTTSVPLMHLKGPNADRRLFGSKVRPATTVAHEYAHAVHFALLPSKRRWELSLKYAMWIGKELANGRSGTHRTEKKTSPLIAYIESIGIFAQRFDLFATAVAPELTGRDLRAAFVADEMSAQPSLAKLMPGYAPLLTAPARGKRGTGLAPTLTGSSTEGAVYGAIFLDFASRTSLANAVNLYLRCQDFSAAGWLKLARTTRKGRYRKDADAVARRWKLT